MVLGIFGKAVDKLKKGLEKTRSAFTSKVKHILTIGRKVDDELLDELEEAMISADMGVEVTQQTLDTLKSAYKNKEIEKAEDILPYLKQIFKKRLAEKSNQIRLAARPPTVVLVAGVNGTGKTTSIGKLAHLFVKEGKKVILAASDTFRAAACEQLEIWAQRVGCDIVKHEMGADPAAVVFDAVDAAVARSADMLIVDTAGRIHTRRNLMEELNKIKRVITKKIPDAPHEVLLVLDATTGQNAISQAREFNEALGVTGLFLAKLDGTAKGGIVIAIKNQLDIPVKLVGLGETLDAIEYFHPDTFVEALFS